MALREKIAEMIGKNPPGLREVISIDTGGIIILEQELQDFVEGAREGIMSNIINKEAPLGDLTVGAAELLMIMGYASEETLVRLLHLLERDRGFRMVLEHIDVCFMERIVTDQGFQEWDDVLGDVMLHLHPFLAQSELELGRVLNSERERFRFVNFALDRLDEFADKGEIPPGFSEEFLEECRLTLELYLKRYPADSDQESRGF